jgi:hypothetical protein
MVADTTTRQINVQLEAGTFPASLDLRITCSPSIIANGGQQILLEQLLLLRSNQPIGYRCAVSTPVLKVYTLAI